MSIRLYFDEHIRTRVAEVLMERGIEVIMPSEVDLRGKDDDTEVLPYAAQHNLVIITFDRPFVGRTEKRTDHAGLICPAKRFRDDIGGLIRLLAEFAENHSLEDVKGQVFWLG